ncbi:MAG: bifunctional demethylmenaquinone methyltransferase/2-methoxy-6-polyprenyl-1,4-benzoquinol methylase UbiE [Bacteroidales bacterium]|jgi:demethylmenaquinone methyltransferase/2-methoxy-6-polyprenyl-1,4-benzoquinol methylase|nr:bifunctional demethylmenaquinone methyltransferase/2-methoxy-6-polyprenyl-1,4-benzoquinol methylase UbiE [Bacteroidales bacterium]
MSDASKKEKLREMFDDISPKYDFLNHFLSFGIDFLWRKKLVRLLGKCRPASVLDVATGTGDLAIAIAAAGPIEITGIDISEKMLEIGRKKLAEKRLDTMINLQCADAESLPFTDNSFDAITVAFGVRNFENLEHGLIEMKRVLRPGGLILILEFSHPSSFPMKQLYTFYSRYLIPVIGRLISGNSQAYRYLPESVAAFPSGKDFLVILSGIGLKNERLHSLSAGIASIYMAEK